MAGVIAGLDCCYLCGLPLSGSVDRDHVPPQMFFARSLRQRHNFADLLTLPTHPTCNQSYRQDEEYFAYALSPLAMDTIAGRAMTEEVGRRLQVGRNEALVARVFQEFEDRPIGLYLPAGRVIKRADAARVNRVLWKIVRGLFFAERCEFLPETAGHIVNMFGPEDEVPERYGPVVAEPSRGRYPTVFDYKSREIAHNRTRLVLWAMLFWNRVLAFVLFHDPSCGCDACST